MPDMKAGRKRWEDLSPTARKLIVVTAVVESVLKALALRDLKRRPASQIRGSKKAWTVAVTLINSAGAAPIVYFLYGRRRPD